MACWRALPTVALALLAAPPVHGVGDMIHHAAVHGDAELVRSLLDGEKDVNARSKENDWTLLMSAAANGHIEVGRVLVKAGADMNLRTRQGDTALHLAVYAEQERMAMELLELGADAKLLAHGQKTMMVLAAESGMVYLMERLLRGDPECVHVEDSAGWTPLFHALASGHYDAAKYLLDVDSMIDHVDHAGRTALHVAAERPFLRGLELLIWHGADLDAETADEETALDIALRKGYDSIADVLSEHMVGDDEEL